MTTLAFGVADLIDVVVSYRDALGEFEETINQLNVFPVPDGDTGTNMRSTVDSVVAALSAPDGVGGPMGAEEFARTVSRASLLGARGNSGIILAQYLQAFTAICSERALVDAGLLTRAFEHASQAARGAVAMPSEGTVLSVADGAARGATAALGEGATLGDLVDSAYHAARAALWATPTQLPVLARSGVVDAGGAGLLLLFRTLASRFGATSSLVGLELPESVRATLLATVGTSSAAGHVASRGPVANYEVLLLLDTDQESIDALMRDWSAIGDSIAIVGTVPTFRCHVHTTDIGRALEAANGRGRAYAIEVTDLDRQVEEQDWVARAMTDRPRSSDDANDTGASPRALAVVAVVDGSGMEWVLRSLGVEVVLQGGAAMNLSTKEFLRGIDRANAREVIVFPNNKNEFAIAHEVARLHGGSVEVVEAPDAAAAASTIVLLDLGRGARENAQEMRRALLRVRTGEVTRAIRDATTEVGAARYGDHLAISGSKILGIAPDLVGAASILVDGLVEDHHELVTMYSGATLRVEELDALAEVVGGRHPNLVIEKLEGGQHHAELLVALE